MRGVCAVVLAAGYGRRFAEQAGREANKLLAPCIGLDGSGQAVLAHSLSAFSQWAGERLLVLRQGSERLGEMTALAANHGFDTLVTPSSGMGDSLSAAVRARAGAAGWLVALGDMPWIRAQTHSRVADAMTAGHAVVPLHEGKRGHPVGFDATYAQALMALSGDQGGRGLLQQGRVTLIEVDDPGVLRDVDLPEDLAL